MKPTGDFVANGAPGRATLRFSNRTFSRQSPLAFEWHDLFDALPREERGPVRHHVAAALQHGGAHGRDGITLFLLPRLALIMDDDRARLGAVDERLQEMVQLRVAMLSP
jgi:hypothetical protein